MMSLVIGITGGIASGKSAVSQYLQVQGYPVVDCDLLTRKAYVDCFEAIKQAFPNCIDGQEINRTKLGQQVFNCAKDKKKLEEIIHPYCRMKMEEAIKNQESELLFLDIPLLFEAKMEDLCDEIWVIYVDEKTQLNRLMARNHLSLEEAKLRITAQMPLERKKDLADVVIDNRKDIARLYEQVQKRLEEYDEY